MISISQTKRLMHKPLKELVRSHTTNRWHRKPNGRAFLENKQTKKRWMKAGYVKQMTEQLLWLVVGQTRPFCDRRPLSTCRACVEKCHLLGFRLLPQDERLPALTRELLVSYFPEAPGVSPTTSPPEWGVLGRSRRPDVRGLIAGRGLEGRQSSQKAAKSPGGEVRVM